MELMRTACKVVSDNGRATAAQTKSPGHKKIHEKWGRCPSTKAQERHAPEENIEGGEAQGERIRVNGPRSRLLGETNGEGKQGEVNLQRKLKKPRGYSLGRSILRRQGNKQETKWPRVARQVCVHV